MKYDKGSLLKWFSLPVFVLVFIIAYWNYTLIDHDEATYVQNTTRHVAEVLQAEIQRVIASPLEAINQMGSNWKRDDGWDEKTWKTQALNFLLFVPSVQSIEWIDRNATIRWIMPYKKHATLIGTQLRKIPDTFTLLKQIAHTPNIMLTPVITLIEGGKGFLAFKSVQDTKNYNSYIAAVFNASKLFQPLLRQALFQDFAFEIRQNNILLYQRDVSMTGSLRPYVVKTILKTQNVDWELTVWPTRQAILAMESSAPESVLMSGTIIAFILALTFYIAGQKIQLGEQSLRAGQEIAEATKKNHLILEKANEGFISVDPQGCILNWNQFAEKIFGWQKKEVLGKRFQEVVIPFSDRKETIGKLLGSVDVNSEGFIDRKMEITAVNKDCNEFPIEMTVFTTRSEGQNTYHAFVRDITERKLVDKMKNEFISMVSHELRTPLTAIKGSISLLLDYDTEKLSEKSVKLLTIAQKNCDRLILLINDILDIEKIESGKFELRSKQFNVMSLIEDAVRTNETYASKFHVKLAIESQSDALLLADYDRLMQVLTNLISNAVKFSKPDSSVFVRVHQAGGRLVLSVEDTGEGIPEAFRTKIFGKFAQADSSSARGKGGTGLGLNICKEIVEMHQGEINFESTEGVGTTFFVYLPFQEVEKEEKQTMPEQKHSDSPDIGKIHILHVEDDPDVVKIIQMLFENEAMISSAKSLHEARALLARKQFDIVILDLALPDGHGASLLPIKNCKTQELMPVVVFSSYEMTRDLGQYVSAGFIKSLTSNELLVRTVRKLAAEYHNKTLEKKDCHEKA